MAGPSVSIDAIQLLVADHFMVTMTRLLSRDREARVRWARFVAMWLCRRDGHLTTLIGQAFGGRDPWAVRNATMRVDVRMRSDGAFADRMAGLMARVDERALVPTVPVLEETQPRLGAET